MELDITKVVEEIAMQAKETQEEFIFETIRPYCENVLQIKINKEELKQILLNGTQKQEPCEDCVYSTKDGYCQYDDITEAIPPLEPCEDAVSRDTLEEAISELTYWHPTTDGRLEVGGAYDNTVYKVEDVWRLTRELPSVTPQKKVGQWITWEEAGNEIPSETRFECSVCHDAAQTLCNGLDLLSLYCPNCGAKMDGGDWNVS